MFNMIQTASYNWISQDPNYGDDWECAYILDISTDKMKYEELAPNYAQSHNLWVADTITHMLETPQGVISCWNSRVFLAWWDKSATVAWATRVEYMIDASGNQKNYFFQNANVQVTNAGITSVVNPEAKPVSGLTTASCVVYKTILYATGSIIYSYDTWADTIGTALSTLTNGVTVKHLYFYNDILVITCTLWSDTIIYQAQYNGTTYELISTEVKAGILCIWAVGDSGMVYWITTDRIFWFSGGQSKEIRFSWDILFGGNLAFIDGDLLIWYGDKIYKWWAKHAWRRNWLTVRSCPLGTIEYITWRYLHVQFGTNYIYEWWWKYVNTWNTVSLPYDMWVNGIEKSNLALRVGYRLTTGTSIGLYIQTDEMIMDNTINWTLIGSITDTTKRNQYFTVGEINTALANDWWKPDWQEIRIKRVMNGGGGTSGARDNTPRFYDLEFIHTQVNERLT